MSKDIDADRKSDDLASKADKPVKGAVPDLSKYMGRGKSRIDMGAQVYVRKFRDNDRS